MDKFHTINQLNTPFNNQKEITVTDPTHPLFGRTFPVSSCSSTVYKGGNISVIYRDYMTLRILFSATNLAGKQDLLTSKFTWDSLYEFVSLAKGYKLCHVNQIGCGRKCRNTSSQKS
ncbi:hypothetical protein [Wolbachia endosymbiont (group A) of Cydia amplana]|uniref:hypothetical protein n=1 Tax=Wolbachia endosymbiont (group A) of Cydia amplana TaxID=3066169 RepID=UPI00333F0A61